MAGTLKLLEKAIEKNGGKYYHPMSYIITHIEKRDMFQ